MASTSAVNLGVTFSRGADLISLTRDSTVEGSHSCAAKSPYKTTAIRISSRISRSVRVGWIQTSCFRFPALPGTEDSTWKTLDWRILPSVWPHCASQRNVQQSESHWGHSQESCTSHIGRLPASHKWTFPSLARWTITCSFWVRSRVYLCLASASLIVPTDDMQLYVDHKLNSSLIVLSLVPWARWTQKPSQSTGSLEAFFAASAKTRKLLTWVGPWTCCH